MTKLLLWLATHSLHMQLEDTQACKKQMLQLTRVHDFSLFEKDAKKTMALLDLCHGYLL